jgi:hypothetical protein
MGLALNRYQAEHEKREAEKQTWLKRCKSIHPEFFERLEADHEEHRRSSSDIWGNFHPPRGTTGAEPYLCGEVHTMKDTSRRICANMFNTQEELDHHRLIYYCSAERQHKKGKEDHLHDTFDTIQTILDKYPYFEYVIPLCSDHGNPCEIHKPKEGVSSHVGYLVGKRMFYWGKSSCGYAQDPEGQRYYLFCDWMYNTIKFCKVCFPHAEWNEEEFHWEGVA